MKEDWNTDAHLYTEAVAAAALAIVLARAVRRPCGLPEAGTSGRGGGLSRRTSPQPRALARRETSVAATGRSAEAPFLLFVLGFGVVVAAAGRAYSDSRTGLGGPGPLGRVARPWRVTHILCRTEDSMNRSSLLVAPAVAAAVLAAPAWTASTASAAPASAPLPCHASMSNYHPADYTTTYVHVHTAAYAGVTTVAHYKTVNRKHTGKAGAKGNATIGYYISGAKPGYKVVVSVRVVKGKRSGSCSTWFTPHR